MKKKIIPFILGCAMLATTSLPVAKAAEVDTDANQFTQYNNTDSNMEITTSIYSTTGTQENTRNGLTGYGSKDYIKVDPTNGNNIPDGDPGSENDPGRTTNLWTAVPTFTLTVPAATVLPLGATAWNIGNVRINGSGFLKPDKVKVEVKTNKFTNRIEGKSGSIPFGVSQQKGGTKISAEDQTDEPVIPIYFYQDGGDTLPSAFPYRYETYTTADYDGNKISKINETKPVWVKVKEIV
jgi:hypothetical protein